MRVSPSIILLFLMGILAIGALYGGGLLLIDPTGQLLGLPISLIETSPFSNFLIPSIILFFVLGVVPLLLVFALAKKPRSKVAERFNSFKDMHWSWSFTIYIAIILMLWIQTQILFFMEMGWMHGFYMLLAITIIFVALLPKVRAHYKY